MKVTMVSTAVVAVLGLGGLAGAVMSTSTATPPADDEPTSQTLDQSRPAARSEAAPPNDQAVQRAFVTAKREWTACVAEAAPRHEAGAGGFDPDVACGTKPHPHGGKPGRDGEARGLGHGKPPWAGGPDRRTAEPPGLAKRDETRSRD